MSLPNDNGHLRASVQTLMVEVAVLKSQLVDSRSALDTQAKEYERRLNELNQSHERAERVLGTYITRERYERWTQDFEVWRRKVEADLANNQGGRSMLVSVFAATLAIGTLIASLWHWI